MAPDSTESLVSSILNPGWMVRHYWRGARSSIHRKERQEAIRQMGLAVRRAFALARDDQFEALLAAVCDGLRPRDEQPF